MRLIEGVFRPRGTREEGARRVYPRGHPRLLRSRSGCWTLAADPASPEFVELVDAKLAELNAVPLARQGRSFALDANRRGGLTLDLPAVLRADALAFDLV